MMSMKGFFLHSIELFVPVSVIKIWKLLVMFVDHELQMPRVRSEGKQLSKKGDI